VATLKRDDPEAFTRLFGQYGLDVAKVDLAALLPYGLFTMDGDLLNTAEKKERILRTPEMAYIFWCAGQDLAFQTAQIKNATRRVFAFLNAPVPNHAGHTVHDYVTSEYGIAQLLDQHVNRPGHVLATVSKAVDAIVATLGKDDPASWTTQDERQMLETYVTLRASTSMTDSTKRADAVARAADNGLASRERGSFVV